MTASGSTAATASDGTRAEAGVGQDNFHTIWRLTATGRGARLAHDSACGCRTADPLLRSKISLRREPRRRRHRVASSYIDMPKSAPVGGTFSGSGREGAMLTMQVHRAIPSDAILRKSLTPVRHVAGVRPLEGARRQGARGHPPRPVREEAAAVGAYLGPRPAQLARREQRRRAVDAPPQRGGGEAAAAGTTRNHPPPALAARHPDATQHRTFLAAGPCAADGGHDDVGRAPRSVGARQIDQKRALRPRRPADSSTRRCCPRAVSASRLDDAAYPTEAKELAERAAAFRFAAARPRRLHRTRALQRPPALCPGVPRAPAQAHEPRLRPRCSSTPAARRRPRDGPHVDDALRARRSDMRRERGRINYPTNVHS